jgi:NDP-sugar pyrophosphorylase family protein
MNPLLEKSQTGIRSDWADTVAVLLVGGTGTRLRPVLAATPKPLAPIGNESFLHLLVRQLRSQGIKRLVMCTGYLADQIEKEFGNGDEWGVAIEYSRESDPRGTAGAVKLAQHYLSVAPYFLVLNGDSFLEIDFHEFIDFHQKHGGLISLGARKVEDANRYGTVRVDTNNCVIGFEEKTGAHTPGLVNGGVYVFSRPVLEHIPNSPASLEKDIFPQLIGFGVYAFEQHGMFIDIGTPQDYARAQEIGDRLKQAALRGTDSVRLDCQLY